MNHLFVRDIEVQDIPLIDTYWRTLTVEDHKRMSIDPKKMPTSDDFISRMKTLLNITPDERQSDPLIWQVDGQAVGLTILNNFQRPVQADIHLHMIAKDFRGKGFGRQLFPMSVKKYFTRHNLSKIICQPAAANLGPNRLMASIGVTLVKTYRTIPSQICFEHEVNRYELYSD